jgi:hypothetical protein
MVEPFVYTGIGVLQNIAESEQDFDSMSDRTRPRDRVLELRARTISLERPVLTTSRSTSQGIHKEKNQ